MIIIVGLGNPGKEYENTRHNTGFIFVNKLAGQNRWEKSKSTGALICWFKAQEIELVKPQDFMNQCGLAVAGVKRKHPELKNEDIYIVHDDLDIPLGQYKIQLGRSAAGHHGVESIIKELGTQDFWRVRVGINTEEFKGLKFKGLKPETYVLKKFPKKERIIIDKVIEQVVNNLNRFQIRQDACLE